MIYILFVSASFPDSVSYNVCDKLDEVQSLVSVLKGYLHDNLENEIAVTSYSQLDVISEKIKSIAEIANA